MSLPSTPVAAMGASTVALFILSFCVGPCLSQPSDLKRLADENTDFGFDLYHKIRDIQIADNVVEDNKFLSPWSISQSLAMTYAGASGNTKSQMAKVLNFDDINNLHETFQDLTTAVFNQPPGNYTMKQANRLFGASNFSFEEAFLDTVRDLYKSPLTQKDFATKPELSRQEINYWVEQQTEDKIKDLMPVGSITDQTVLVLVNALYFKAKWKIPFKAQDTTTGNFTLKEIPGGEDEYTEVPMMSRRAAVVMYLHNTVAEYKMLELPYSGNHMSMFVILPDETNGIDNVTEYLSADNIRGDMKFLEKAIVDIELPKFQIRASFKLKGALQQMGMQDAFSNAANFSDMTDGPVKISDVYHQAFVDVNEEGTEAAAATGTGIISKSVGPKAEEFKVDHPFLFFIRENKTGSILFMGKIGNPAPTSSS